ncbi:DUF86 domain-containing protein [Candidatus Uhrbacteria bacterium]|nr:DUF86 domain-containing protein [Candidatus Uhrbacteria bacterium]
MTIACDKIFAKLRVLDEYLAHLGELRSIDKQDFLKEYRAYGTAEHYLHLSIEVLLDVARLLTIVYQLPRPEDPSAAFHIVHERGILNDDLLTALAGVNSFRNILIHEYETVEMERVYQYLQENLNQFTEFKHQVLRFLKEHPIPS